jgi:hypothetical protein
LLRSLSDADLNALEEYIQHTVQDTFGGFLTCCRTATDDLVGLARVVREAVRRFLDARLGEVDFGGMMRVRYGPPAAALKDAYEKAEPTLVGGGPWTRTELRVYPEVPLAALPQLGPQWESAYRAAPEAAHTRTDVLRWTDVDAG